MTPRYFHRDNLIKAAFLLCFLMASAYAMLNYMHSSLLRERYVPTRFEGIYDGTGFRPYVYRMLVPALTRSVVALTPVPVQEGVNGRIGRFLDAPETRDSAKPLLPWLKQLFRSGGDHYPRLVALAIVYGCLVGYGVVMWRLSAVLFPGDPAMHYFSPCFALLALPAFSWPFQYLYDFSTLLLSAGCFYFMLTQRLRAYVFCFFLACLNKETAVLIAVLFALWFYGRLPRRAYGAYLLAQAAIFVAVKVAVTYLYMDNPGGIFESHTAAVLKSDIFTKPNSFRLIAVCGLFFLLTYRFREKPLFARYALWFVPFWVAAYILFGNPGEYRICFDMLPLLTLLATHTLIETTGVSKASWFQKDAA